MRAPPIAPRDLSPAVRPLHDEMAATIAEHLKGFVSHRADGALVGPFAPILTFPAFGRPVWDYIRAIIDHAALPRPVREVAILAVGAALDSRYELYAHEHVAEASGLADAKIACIVAGHRPPDLTDAEAAAYDVADALARGRKLPETTWNRAVALFGHDGAGELVYLVGCYCVVSVILNAFDVGVPGRDDPA